MNIQKIQLDESQVNKLLSMASGDAALLYLYLRSGNPMEEAPQALHLSPNALSCAQAVLRQLGLWSQEQAPAFLPGQRPAYSETDVLGAMDTDRDFRSLYGEIQRLLGKTLNTEELKILLGFSRYLGLSNDVISVLVCYCKERARNRGSLRSPSLRTIEKEAYAWAEQGIDTLEQAGAYIRTQNLRQSRIHKLKQLLQIRGRDLTAGETRYAEAWLQMGFEDKALEEAYERTCLKTGGLSWPYMNKILISWHEAGLHTLQAIKNGDRKPAQSHRGARGEMGQAELEAIAQVMQEG